MDTRITEEGIRKIREEVESEFPEDPALQEVHIARKIIAMEAKRAGVSYLQYIKMWKKSTEKNLD